MKINKSLLTNLFAILLVILGMMNIPWNSHIFSVGIFALSGAITNWLAIYMLFEKVPLIYGSGVIPIHFEEFKTGIRNMVMEQFFTQENIQKFIQSEEASANSFLNLSPILDQIDYDALFQKMSDAIMASKFGSMLNMFGGEKALEPLRQPFEQKIHSGLEEMTQSESFRNALRQSLNNQKINHDWIDYIEQIIDDRLAQLTPTLVKEILQKMIQEHLGWLVVWGGVFGGLMGLLASFIEFRVE